MSLDAPLATIIPEQTARVARAAFPKGNPYMRLRDTFGPLFSNPDFADLFPKHGAPAQAPALLALISVMQFAEGLADRQAADAVRSTTCPAAPRPTTPASSATCRESSVCP